MQSKSNATSSIKPHVLEIGLNLFLRFLNIASSDVYTLLAALIPPPECGDEVLGGNSPADPVPGGLEVVLGQVAASQLHLELGEQEEVGWGQVRRVGGVFQHLDAPGGQPVLDRGSRIRVQ